jgi:ketosteroid isomerase-like protein
MKKLILSFIISSIFFSCDTPRQLSEDDMRTLMHEYNSQLEKCFLNQDIVELSKLYAPDARLSPDGDNFYEGREAITNFWKEDFASSKLVKMHTNTLSVNGTEEIIYETGITQIETLYKDSVYKSEVKYINVWRLQPDKAYKLSIDFWNNNKK